MGEGCLNNRWRVGEKAGDDLARTHSACTTASQVKKVEDCFLFGVIYPHQIMRPLLILNLMSKPLTARNKKLIRLRKKGLSFAQLGRIFKISRITAYQIYARQQSKDC
jgi:hypothetical protein